jgi:DNA mismatch endonuclease (patch repair protein)
VKIEGNRATDERNLESLLASGWRVATVWECSIKGKKYADVERVVSALGKWLRSGNETPRVVEIGTAEY